RGRHDPPRSSRPRPPGRDLVGGPARLRPFGAGELARLLPRARPRALSRRAAGGSRPRGEGGSGRGGGDALRSPTQDPHHPGPLLPASPPPAGRRGRKTLITPALFSRPLPTPLTGRRGRTAGISPGPDPAGGVRAALRLGLRQLGGHGRGGDR